MHKQLEDFEPSAKFWSAKVLVSIAFLQEFALAIVAHIISGFNEFQQQLVYSSFLCYEVFAVSIFHIYAWCSDEPWLLGADAKRRKESREQARKQWSKVQLGSVKLRVALLGTPESAGNNAE